MNKKKFSKHNKRIITITLLLISISVYSLVASRKATGLETVMKDTISNIEYYIVKTPFRYVGNLFSEFSQLKDVYNENKTLKEQLDTYARLSAMNDTLSHDINSLKELLDIDYLPTDYKVKYTKIISRDAESWTTTVTIDLGKNSNISEGMAVISSSGMIGTVTNVNAISSEVSLLCDESPSYQLPVMILNGDETVYGLIEKYDTKQKCYVISLLTDVDKLSEGSTVATSGLGGTGKSPKGILIGRIDSTSIKTKGNQKVCYVTPSSNFNELEYVAVVQRVNK